MIQNNHLISVRDEGITKLVTLEWALKNLYRAIINDLYNNWRRVWCLIIIKLSIPFSQHFMAHGWLSLL
jgi:hypothetical protein